MAILLIAVVLAGCTLFPTATDTAAGGTTTTTEPPTGWRAIFANYGTWIWLAILAVAFYFLLIRPQRTRSRKAQDLMSSIKRGDEIVTIGGFYGRIKDVRDDTVIITIAGGVDVKIAKSAISRVVTSQGIADTSNKQL
ncbi:MAG: preprotein translocase subunit YajC [Actinobacteria bacterium]|nr:preprotein translocase subunit YajC [Actinomycetota bacterium]MBM3713201.1 preprotein translocase subunit YajC [Actinomycetota bacterium]